MFDHPEEALSHMEDLVRRDPPAECDDVEAFLEAKLWKPLYDGEGNGTGAGYQYIAKEGRKRSIWVAGEM